MLTVRQVAEPVGRDRDLLVGEIDLELKERHRAEQRLPGNAAKSRATPEAARREPATACVSGPDTRTIATAPTPGGVAIAAMVQEDNIKG